MSISSSLNAGVAGLNSNGTRLATISDNISNASTYGYKRAVAEFQNMVIGEGTGLVFPRVACVQPRGGWSMCAHR